MSLPRQVQDTLKELEKIEEQLAAEQRTPKEPKAADAPDNQQQAQPQNTDPAPAPEPAPEVKAEKPVEPPVADEKWEQKYKTLKGMYDAEVPRLHAQVKDLTARLDSLQRAPEPKPEPKAAAVHEKLVTDADVQAFGEDLIEVQRKVAREVAAEFRKDLDDLKAENVKLREQLTTTGTKVSESTFETRLHRLVPDFEEVNVDPRWIDWLNEVDPLLRGPRKTVAEQAYISGDAEGVAYYVKMFKDSLGTVEQPKPKAAELERQIQPSRSAASAPTVAPKGKVYTDSQIQDMYRKASQMASRGQLEDARKLEAEIDSAFMEGRVTA
jgi:hypothetical protein